MSVAKNVERPVTAPVYVSSFEEKILGVKSDVEVSVNLLDASATVVVAMRQPLRSSPSCHISLAELESLKAAIQVSRERAPLLDAMVDGATNHQINCAWGGVTLIVVKPLNRPARFTLVVDEFHREGPLAELSSGEVDEAIAKLTSLRAKVLAKVGK